MQTNSWARDRIVLVNDKAWLALDLNPREIIGLTQSFSPIDYR